MKISKRGINAVLTVLSVLMIIIIAVSIANIATAQDGFSYQAVVSDLEDEVVRNGDVSLQISILSDEDIVYRERHFVQTNAHGIVSTVIGSGTALIGSMSEIDWSKSYSIESSVDLSGLGNYQTLGVSELLPVPYAMYARSVDVDLTGYVGIELFEATIKELMTEIDSMQVKIDDLTKSKK